MIICHGAQHMQTADKQREKETKLIANASAPGSSRQRIGSHIRRRPVAYPSCPLSIRAEIALIFLHDFLYQKRWRASNEPNRHRVIEKPRRSAKALCARSRMMHLISMSRSPFTSIKQNQRTSKDGSVGTVICGHIILRHSKFEAPEVVQKVITAKAPTPPAVKYLLPKAC